MTLLTAAIVWIIAAVVWCRNTAYIELSRKEVARWIVITHLLGAIAGFALCTIIAWLTPDDVQQYGIARSYLDICGLLISVSFFLSSALMVSSCARRPQSKP
jgi:hypothetical protein